MSNQIATMTRGAPISPLITTVLTIYLILFMFWGLYSLVTFRPQGKDGDIEYIFWTLSLSDEVRLLLIVVIAGALGSTIHAHRSFYWCIGNRGFVSSWIQLYFVHPLVGSTLALIFYLVIRGGFFAPGTSIEATSPFGFVALAGLIGLFSEQAFLKLKEVADTLFAKPEPGEDAKTQQP